MHAPHSGTDATRSALSIVVPVYNEEEVLPAFHERMVTVLASIPMDAEIVYINDGSSDRTLEIIQDLRRRDPRVAIINLSRNFGKEIALSAGLDLCRGDAAIIIDADLQDPPELIPVLIDEWRQGFDVVYAKRLRRGGESGLRRLTAHLFYRVMGRVSQGSVPEDTGDFRLLSRRAVDSLRRLREHHRFMKGLFSWIGYPQKAVSYQRDPRSAGSSKWDYWKLWNFALEGLTSFTITPLKVATYVGLTVALLAFAFAIVIIYRTLVYGDPVPGYPSLMVVVLLLGGVQLIGLGIMGEYVGRMFVETKNRPLYLVAEFMPSSLPEIRDTADSRRWSP
jgi:glycosyltransferase involved in cell wall biosynthesis